MYVKVIDNQVVGTFNNLPPSYSNVSNFNTLSAEQLKVFNIYEVLDAPCPPYNSLTKTSSYSIEFSKGVAIKVWAIVDKDNTQVQQAYTKALETWYDTKAREKYYDNRMSCCIRAGYAGPYQQEGKQFGVWMDSCNEHAYHILSEVVSGALSIPTVEDFLKGLPTPPWGDAYSLPESVT